MKVSQNLSLFFSFLFSGLGLIMAFKISRATATYAAPHPQVSGTPKPCATSCVVPTPTSSPLAQFCTNVGCILNHCGNSDFSSTQDPTGAANRQAFINAKDTACP